MAEEMAMDLCILSQIGWVDAEGQEDMVTIQGDIMGLHPNVSASLSEDELSACAEDMMEEWGDSKEARR